MKRETPSYGLDLTISNINQAQEFHDLPQQVVESSADAE